MSFLHGIEHLNLAADFAPVNDVVTAVIGLVGTASEGELNKLTLCRSAKDDASFGTKGTIPEALRAIRLQDSKRGSTLVLVVSVAAESDALPTASQIIGTIDATGERTGLKLFELAGTQFGFEPGIYIVPRFSALAAVKQELIAVSNKTETMAYIDAPDGFTFPEALASRAPSGTFVALGEGQKFMFPHFLIADPDNNGEYLNVPMSAYAAGLRAKVDLEDGWHCSSSNHPIIGPESLDVPLSFSLGDPNCEANLLNGAGITTSVSLYGKGFVEWGNYSAGYPASAHPENFECVRRTRAIMKRVIEQSCLQFIDKPFIKANVDAIRNTVNQYLNGLVARGRIVYGKCFYRPESNPAGQLAAGHLTFDIEFTPALPMQRLTFTYKIELSQLSTIV